MELAIIGLGLLFFIGHGFNWFFEKTKIPDLLLLVLLGYLIGPTLNIVNADDFGKIGSVISTMTLIVILYESGLHLSAKSLLRSSLPAAVLSISSFISITLIGTLLAYVVAGQDLPISILFGVGIGSTSSAVVIPMVQKLSITEKVKTILSLESAFTDVLSIVIFLALIDSFISGHFSASEIIIDIGPKTALAMLCGLSAGVLWAFIKKRWPLLISMSFAGEAWALLIYGIIEFFQYNGAIGVLALGFMLANLELLPKWLNNTLSAIPVRYKDLSLLSEITFILRTFFFIYLGLLIEFSKISTVLFALLASAAIFLSRYVCAKAIFSSEKFSQLDIITSFAMGPRGLACAVLATIPLQKKMAGGDWLEETLFALIPMTIAITAILVGLAENKKTRTYFNRFFKKRELPEELPS